MRTDKFHAVHLYVSKEEILRALNIDVAPGYDTSIRYHEGGLQIVVSHRKPGVDVPMNLNLLVYRGLDK